MKSRTTIDGFDAAPPPDDEKMVDPLSPKCYGCGRYHGSVNFEINCLREVIRTLKLRLNEKDEQLVEIRQSLAERGESLEAVQRPIRESLQLPCSRGGYVEFRRNAGKNATFTK